MSEGQAGGQAGGQAEGAAEPDDKRAVEELVSLRSARRPLCMKDTI